MGVRKSELEKKMGDNIRKNKIVLFGCGEIGYQVLQMLGSKNILCFCDNNQMLHGTVKWGKRVLSLGQLKKEHSDYTIIVCVKLPKAYYITTQLDREGEADYWIYPLIEQKIAKLPVNKILELLCDKNSMYQMRIKNYQNKILELETQLNYMKRHADIRSMKPAAGRLRERQLALADLGGFLCQAVGNLGVKPFLCGGNLLGYVRNNGFIPWDDDMDFNLIRKDYECLRQYCLSHRDETGCVPFQYNGRTEILSFHEHYKMFGLQRWMANEPSLPLDFFSLDYYADDYPYESLRADAKKIQTDAYNLGSTEERIAFVRAEMKKNPNIVEKSSSIFYGFDNMESIRPYDIGKMMPENVVFPLKKITFEGRWFWIPNKPEEYLSYNFEDIWSFPDDVGLQRHI